MIKGIAFDLEGPLVNVEQPHFDGFFAVAQELSIDGLGFTKDAESFEELIPGAIGGGDPFILENLLRLAREEVSEERLEEIRLRKMEVYNDSVGALVVVPRAGSITFIETVKGELGLPVAIGSLTPREQAVALFEQSGVDDWFPRENIVLREDVENVKPAPDVYIETARRMGIDPSEQLVFEDSGTGVRAAVAAQSRVIAMPVYATAKYTAKLKGVGAMEVFGAWEEPSLLNLVRSLAS